MKIVWVVVLQEVEQGALMDGCKNAVAILSPLGGMTKI